MTYTEPQQVGERWIVAETDGAETVEYGYPTQAAAQAAFVTLTRKAAEHSNGVTPAGA